MTDWNLFVKLVAVEEFFMLTNVHCAKAHWMTYNCGRQEQRANYFFLSVPAVLEEFSVKADNLVFFQLT